jgi:hypothetical protein
LSQNLSFLREGLAENLDSSAIVSGLEDEQFKKANETLMTEARHKGG